MNYQKRDSGAHEVGCVLQCVKNLDSRAHKLGCIVSYVRNPFGEYNVFELKVEI